MKKLAEFVIRYRWAVIVFFLALTAFMGFQMKNASFNPDLLTYLPEHLPSRMNQKQIEKMFGGTDMVMIVVQTDDVVNGKTLERVEHFSQDMQNIKETSAKSPYKIVQSVLFLGLDNFVWKIP